MRPETPDEITGVPGLLDPLALQNSIITLDAVGVPPRRSPAFVCCPYGSAKFRC